MGFLDDLDSAFDSLLSQPAETEPAAKEATFEIEQETLALKAGIAIAQGRGVRALIQLIPDLPRQPVLVAIHGSLKHLSLIDPLPDELTTAPNGLSLLETQKKSIRRRLSKEQKAALESLAELFEAPSQKECQEAKDLLTALALQRAVPAQEYHALYTAGIWQAEQFNSGSVEQLALLSGLPQERIQALKDATNAS